jgi:Glycosyltransferase Family 4
VLFNRRDCQCSLPGESLRLLRIVSTAGGSDAESRRSVRKDGMSAPPSAASAARWSSPRASSRADRLRQQARLTRDLVADEIDVVHSEDDACHAFVVPAAYLAGAPVIVVSIHDAGAALTRRERRLRRFVCGLADVLLVSTLGLKDDLTDAGYDSAKVVVLSEAGEAGHLSALYGDQLALNPRRRCWRGLRGAARAPLSILAEASLVAAGS